MRAPRERWGTAVTEEVHPAAPRTVAVPLSCPVTPRVWVRWGGAAAAAAAAVDLEAEAAS